MSDDYTKLKKMPQIVSDKDRARFFSKTKKRGDCLEWTAARSDGSYGRFNLGYTWYAAHRFSYYLATGKDPAKLRVCHSCDNPCCVNIDHLFLGTMSDNNKDCVRKKRHKFVQKTHCHRGHDLNDAKVFITKSGGKHRTCRKCWADNANEYRLKHGDRVKATRIKGEKNRRKKVYALLRQGLSLEMISKKLGYTLGSVKISARGFNG